MKKKYGLIALVIFAALSIGWVSGYHDHVIPTADDTYDIGSTEREWRDIHSDGTIYSDGIDLHGILTFEDDTYIGSGEQVVTLPLNAFSVTGVQITSVTTPKLAANNTLSSIVWVDADTAKAEQSFKLPPDYHSGGKFRLLADLSSSGTDAQLDFDVYTSRENLAWDAAVTDQTAVYIKSNTDHTRSIGIGSPELVTLTPTSDLDGRKAGDIITLRLFRLDSVVYTVWTGDLEVYYVEFVYNY